jgi:predicted AAA+ superfamily ATPase
MGARQVGKTTLLDAMFPASDRVLRLNADEPDVPAMFENISSDRLRHIIGGKDTIVIDEAQRIENIGLKLKLITDQMKDVNVVATGSSSFELANKVNEPLTGRKTELHMFPVSFGEMVDHHGLLEERRLLSHRLVYGMYPEVITEPGNEKDILRSLSDSYLYKDIFAWGQIKKSDKLVKLLRALAFQVGSQVSYPELGQICGLDAKTVEKYIVLLEQAYIIFRLHAFSRNLRNELSRSRKVYFYDNGIRNAVIANFSSAEMRQDVGALFENYMISERMKKISYNRAWSNSWFWRTTEQREIDYIEETNGNLSAYEFKWNPSAKGKIPVGFRKGYPDASTEVVSRENYETFLLDIGSANAS